MDIGPATGEAPATLTELATIHDQAGPIEGQPHELMLGRCGPAACAGSHRYTRSQDDTSESQLMARWRSRARSPMSIPVVVAIASIGVLMRSSGE